MNAQIDVCTVGRVWDDETPHVTQAYLAGFGHRLSLLTGRPLRPFHWNVEKHGYPGGDVLLVQPAFQAPGGKAVIATRSLLLEAKARKAKIVLATIDVELLKSWGDFVNSAEVEHALVTNFERPWAKYRGRYQTHTCCMYMPMDRLAAVEERQPKFTVGYVGWPKPKRFQVLRKLGYRPLVMMGFGADKQQMFDCAFCDANTPWTQIGELYKAAAWHLCVSDNEINDVRPAIFRLFEAWHFGRPCIFHKTIRAGRPQLDWESVREWWGDDEADVHRISLVGRRDDGSYDLDALRGIAAVQATHLKDYWHRHPSAAEVAAYVLGGELQEAKQMESALLRGDTVRSKIGG